MTGANACNARALAKATCGPFGKVHLLDAYGRRTYSGNRLLRFGCCRLGQTANLFAFTLREL